MYFARFKGIPAAAALLFASSVPINPAAGAIILSMDNVNAAPGQTTSVGVYAAGVGEVISGFNLPIDFNNDGYIDGADLDTLGELPAGFTFGPGLIANSIFANTGLDAPPLQLALIDADTIATGSGSDQGLSAVPTKLFDLVINVGPGVPAGTVLPFELFDDGGFFNVTNPVLGGSAVVLAPTLTTPVFGSITVVVPEPGTLTLLAAAAVPALARRRPNR